MIIVTGGAGFIGSAFVWKCNQEGLTDIIIVDELEKSEKWKNLVGLSYQDYLHKSVFIEAIQSETFTKKVEAVIHMGACSSTTERDMDYLMENNYRYTKTLAQWCVKHQIRFIYASSAATYGNGDLGFSDSESQIPDLRPINGYGYSKQFFDLFALRSDLLTSIVGLKFFNVYGPNEFHKEEMKSVVCKAYSQILETGELKLFKSYRPEYADGGQMRDFIYVKDVVDVMWWLMKHPEVNGIYNVGTSQARTWNELADAIFKAMNKEKKIVYIDMPESIRSQYQYYTQADMGKLHAEGCPVHMRTLDEAVQDYVQHYLAPHDYLR